MNQAESHALDQLLNTVDPHEAVESARDLIPPKAEAARVSPVI